MPKLKGKSRKSPILRCYTCGSRKVFVGRNGNTRVIHGVQKVVAPCVCADPDCRTEWWSYNPEALAAMKLADSQSKSRVIVTGSSTPA